MVAVSEASSSLQVRPSWEKMLDDPEWKFPVNCIQGALIAIQLVGIALMFFSLAGTTQLIPMSDLVIIGLAIGGFLPLIISSLVWSKLGFVNKHASIKKGLCVIAAIALAAIAIGLSVLNGNLPGMELNTARFIFGSGGILVLPLFGPALYAFLACMDCLKKH